MITIIIIIIGYGGKQWRRRRGGDAVGAGVKSVKSIVLLISLQCEQVGTARRTKLATGASVFERVPTERQQRKGRRR